MSNIRCPEVTVVIVEQSFTRKTYITCQYIVRSVSLTLTIAKFDLKRIIVEKNLRRASHIMRYFDKPQLGWSEFPHCPRSPAVIVTFALVGVCIIRGLPTFTCV
jgi:hypothetical protein